MVGALPAAAFYQKAMELKALRELREREREGTEFFFGDVRENDADALIVRGAPDRDAQLVKVTFFPQYGWFLVLIFITRLVPFG